MSRNKPTGSEGKGESVAERAVRGALAGYIHCERTPGMIFNRLNGGYCCSVLYVIPESSVKTMLRRERSHAREKARAKSDPGGYIGEALSSIGDQKRAAKKKPKRKGTRNG